MIVPAVVDTQPSDTEPTDAPTDTTPSEPSETSAAIKPAKKSGSADYSSFIWLGVIAVLLLLIYLRYHHLSKKGMSFPDICKNFIPIGGGISKSGSSKKADNYKLDGPQPEVKNGYLQKPTVGAAAAQAYRPVRSNTSTAAPSVARKPSASANNAAGPAKAAASTGTAPSKAARQPRVNAPDPELHEMVLRQRELEQKLKELSSEKKNIFGDDAPKPDN